MKSNRHATRNISVHNGRTKKQIQVQSSPYADGTAERSPGAKRGTSARLLRSALAG